MCPKSEAKITVLFQPAQQVAIVKAGATVLEAALKIRLPLNHECGGMGTCGTCRVQVNSSFLNNQPRNEIEQEMAVARGFSPEERLACQLIVEDQMKVIIPES